jgi:hypothetical protein
MAKTTNPKDAALESDVLIAAGSAPAPVNQQDVKDKAQEIGDQANKASGETVEGIPANMTGQPAQGTQLPGSGLPPVASTRAAGTPPSFGNPAPGNAADPEYLEFLEWKKKKWVADQLEGDRLSAEYQEQERKEKAATEAAKRAYDEVMKSQTTPHPDPDGEIKSLNANKLHEDRVKMYGEGYVVAQRQGVTQVFTRQTWKLLGGRNNSDGYTEVVATPPEIANLKKNQ